MLAKVRLWIAGALVALVAGLMLAVRILTAQRDAARSDATAGAAYRETRQRIDDAPEPADPAAARDWLRDRADR